MKHLLYLGVGLLWLTIVLSITAIVAAILIALLCLVGWAVWNFTGFCLIAIIAGVGVWFAYGLGKHMVKTDEERKAQDAVDTKFKTL